MLLVTDRRSSRRQVKVSLHLGGHWFAVWGVTYPVVSELHRMFLHRNEYLCTIFHSLNQRQVVSAVLLVLGNVVTELNPLGELHRTLLASL